MLEHGAGTQIAELGLDERAQVSRGPMLNGEDRVQLVVVLDDHARTHLCGGNRHKKNSFIYRTDLGEPRWSQQSIVAPALLWQFSQFISRRRCGKRSGLCGGTRPRCW